MNILLIFIIGITVLSFVSALLLIFIKVIELGLGAYIPKIIGLVIVVYVLIHFIVKYW